MRRGKGGKKGDFVHCISISHKNANVAVREKLAFSGREQEKFIRNNMVILSTCNRTEFYFTDCSVSSTAREICGFKGFPYDDFKKIMKVYTGDGAVLNLYRVACGLESEILGEDEILGQVKAAYYFAHERVKLSYEINTVFKGAVTAAKKIKTETLMSKSAVSIGTLVAGFIHSRGLKKALVIGISGKTGTIIAKNLLSYKDIAVSATLRDRREDYIKLSNVSYIPYSERYKYMGETDVVISATTSPHYTVTAGEILRQGIKGKVFIDLAVPRDIDEDISENDIYNIDYFKTLSETNSGIKLKERDRVNIIIEEMLDELNKELFFHSLLGELEEFDKYSPKQLIYKARDGLSASEFKKLIDVLRG